MIADYDGLLQLLPISGVRIGAAKAGMKYVGHRDLALFELHGDTNVAAVFTRNAFCAAPVIVAQSHLTVTAPLYLLINTGNANAGTGKHGVRDALACCSALADIVGCATEAVVPFSTGVIGESLPVPKIVSALPQAVEALASDNWEKAALAIMTTDTVPKGISRQFVVGGETVTITGIAKGAGMIRPDMATMLAYVATDAAVDADTLQRSLAFAVARSFNRITSDSGSDLYPSAFTCQLRGQSVAFYTTETRQCISCMSSTFGTRDVVEEEILEETFRLG